MKKAECKAALNPRIWRKQGDIAVQAETGAARRIALNLTYLAIDKDAALHNRESALWLRCGISSIRTTSMDEGIAYANDKQFLFIVINANNIDYMPKLRILRGVTADPILIATSNFAIEEQVEALHNGADFYGEFSETDKNMKVVLAVINSVSERAGQRKDSIKIITYGDIIMIPDYRKVFGSGSELLLTKMEFDILYYLLSNRGRVLSHEQIYSFVFDDNYDEPAYDAVKSAIKRLRKKIGDKVAIESVRGVGYRAPIVDVKVES